MGCCFVAFLCLARGASCFETASKRIGGWILEGAFDVHQLDVFVSSLWLVVLFFVAALLFGLFLPCPLPILFALCKASCCDKQEPSVDPDAGRGWMGAGTL